jgi:outer membrane protein assembly factor BamB
MSAFYFLKNMGKDHWLFHTGIPVIKVTAVISGLFCFAVSILMISGYIQLALADPLNSPALLNLLDELEEKADDEELLRQIRELDLLARKAYFTQVWQMQAGSYLLLGSAAVFILCLNVLAVLRKKSPVSDKDYSNKQESRPLTRRVLLSTGILLFASSLVIGFNLNPASSIIKSHTQEEKSISTEQIIIEAETESYWSSFRGPGGLSLAPVETSTVNWDGQTGEGINWKVKVPKPGKSSPVVWENRIFLTGADMEGEEVYCFDAASGELLWQYKTVDIPGSPLKPPEVSVDTGYAAPTMVTDGGMVYALFASGNLVCLDMDGNMVWAKNIGVPANHYGHSSSPMLFHDLIILQYDQSENSRVFALKKESGEMAWQTARDVMTCWSSPILINTSSGSALVLNGNPFVVSYNPLTGEELWRVDCLFGEIGASPSSSDGNVFAASEYAPAVCIDALTGEIRWEVYGYLPAVSSPLASDGFLIIATSYGIAACYSTQDFNLYWEHEFEEGFYASPVLAGDNVYLLDRSGIMHIVKLAPEYSLVNECMLGEASDCTPAFLKEYIIIRGSEHLFCIEGVNE